MLMSVEHAPQGRRGLFGSVVAMGLPAGIVLSNLVFIVASTALTPEQFSAWGWRIPFIASVVLVAVGMFVRLGVAESPVFAERDADEDRATDAGRSTCCAPTRRTVLLAAGQLRRHQRSRVHPARLLRDATRRVASVSLCRRRSC